MNWNSLARVIGLVSLPRSIIAPCPPKIDAPVSGTITAVNEALADKPETINEDAYGDGWLFTLQIDDAEQLNELLSPDDYSELLEDEDH